MSQLGRSAQMAGKHVRALAERLGTRLLNTTSNTAAQADVEHDRQRAVLPAVDVFEDAGGITLLADMPDVPRSSSN